MQYVGPLNSDSKQLKQSGKFEYVQILDGTKILLLLFLGIMMTLWLDRNYLRKPPYYLRDVYLNSRGEMS